MTDDEKKAAEEQARKDAEAARTKLDADNGSKLDKLLTGLDSLGKRMDAMEMDSKARKDADEKREKEDKDRADSEACADAAKRFTGRKDGESDEDFKSRRDAEEEGEKKGFMAKGDPEPVAADKAKRARKDADGMEEKADKARKDAARIADAARASSVDPATVTDLVKKVDALTAHNSGADRAAFSDEQARADGVYAAHGNKAPAPMLGESLAAYRHRLLSPLKAHSPAWRDVDLLHVADPVAFSVAQSQIYADSMEAARNPLNGGETLRKVEKTLPSGHRQISFYGSPGSWMGRFAGARQMVRAVNTGKGQ